jgi:hypothetical protein
MKDELNAALKILQEKAKLTRNRNHFPSQKFKWMTVIYEQGAHGHLKAWTDSKVIDPPPIIPRTDGELRTKYACPMVHLTWIREQDDRVPITEHMLRQIGENKKPPLWHKLDTKKG